MSNQGDYSVDDIKILKGLDAVRKRPGMYIGSTSSRGLHHLVWEIVDNGIDEALAGFASVISVELNNNGSVTVKDNGRGIPTGIHPDTGVSTVETVLTRLHAGGKFDGETYKVSGGLHGVGASVVNALSSYLEVKVYQNGKIFFMNFENGGKVKNKLEIIDSYDGEASGTEVTFVPDSSIFKETVELDYETLRARLRELAFLNKNLKIVLKDLRGNEERVDEFQFEGGIKEYVKLLNKPKTPIHKSIFHVEDVIDNIVVEAALQYNKGYSEAIYSFVNNIKTPEGGFHEDGVKPALTRVINRYGKEKKIIKDKDETIIGEDVREGLTMIISVKHPDPQFEGQTKTKLGNYEVKEIASKIFADGFARFLMENPEEGKVIVSKAIDASKSRIAAKKARELTRRKGGLELTSQWGKLTDCSSKNVKETEIFIVEGNSAAGPAKQGRDSRIQAVLPIRGKILNVEKSRIDKVLGNEEIRSLITAFGTGIGEEFDIAKLRYDKIIIMTDADVDGSHIRTLLLTFFYRFFKPLVETGHIYAAQPPLFKISHGKTNKYVLNQNELDEYLATLGENTKYEISRMKGLGEMDSVELRETTMKVDTRNLLNIELEDSIIADETFQILMGEEVAPRRKFIEDNALNVRNLDV
ncbi:DNA topoisomerase (ATP-hydrolyzing) subunit B [Methanobrevibacter curvatus]|uniref:DNA gyrase subunit B n=1 Tax=Methanobrevibacter curvatus TaxID=49547 RepID=A0A165ZKI1_9EURY|nr:DNA topoisomerase (ATP-hydrolyzing) subunit B [Methanobrevibacter curvatus]KZX10834.1 DNA gyrase subunit B [Methanobrevibacter curvatus]